MSLDLPGYSVVLTRSFRPGMVTTDLASRAGASNELGQGKPDEPKRSLARLVNNETPGLDVI